MITSREFSDKGLTALVVGRLDLAENAVNKGAIDNGGIIEVALGYTNPHRLMVVNSLVSEEDRIQLRSGLVYDAIEQKYGTRHPIKDLVVPLIGALRTHRPLAHNTWDIDLGDSGVFRYEQLGSLTGEREDNVGKFSLVLPYRREIERIMREVGEQQNG